MFLASILPIIVAYLLGSIPTAVWIGKAFFGIDIRTQGSGNAGATNTIRVLGIKAGIPVLLIDILKGFISVMIAPALYRLAGGDGMLPYIVIASATAAVLGHTFPIFAGFKGGKGVATLLGVGLGLFPWAALCAIVVFAIVLLISKYVSLGSIIAGICFPVLVIFIFHPQYDVYYILAVLVAIFLPITHRKNIKRLFNGTESKFTFKGTSKKK